MYNTFQESISYSPEDVLNPIVLLFNSHYSKNYYQYFKKLNKPLETTSIVGVKIETYNNFLSENLINHFNEEQLKILQFEINKPLKKNNTYLFTLFNTTEEEITYFFSQVIRKNKKEKLTISILVCHPLTSVNEYISNLDNQLNIAKSHNCPMSVINLFDY